MKLVLRAMLAGGLPGLLPSCAHRGCEYSLNPDGGSYTKSKADAVAAWNRSVALSGAGVKLRPLSDHPAFCRIKPGHQIVVYASQGYSVCTTANVLEYWAAVFCLPSDISAGQTLELKWAADDSVLPLRTGEVSARSLQVFRGTKRPSVGTSAGRVAVRSRSATVIHLSLELRLPFQSMEANRRAVDHALLKREMDLPLRRMRDDSRTLLAYPAGASEEVEIPQLGSIWAP